MKPQDLLLCVYSYNMGVTLENCLSYINELAPGFDVVLMDDASSDPLTIEAIERHAPRLKAVFVNRDPKEGRKHGNLYRNIQRMCDYATEQGYRYIFSIQDDMQFVRPLSANVISQYQAIFDADEMMLQVDPRFLRFSRDFDVLPDIAAYKNKGPTSYADVGIIDLARLQESRWRIVEGERANRDGLAALGYKRVFARTPVLMHVPFPQTYRNGALKRSLLLRNRGKYGYQQMTEEQIRVMDARDLADPPFFRKYLKVRNMHLSRIMYHWCSDLRVLA
ncbi:hypothetical protein [Mesorhizobium marinum]|uniref:Glycosyl transferase family 2 n=1 Tax=Mesorhizobium marinum TaxID=3228790 RepID=A0ABV3R0U6_9HYPH